MKKILITGADGFIGSHLTELLVKKGYNVKVMIYYNSFNSYGWLDTVDPKIKKEIEFCPGDVRNFDSVFSIMKNCDRVIHLAALIGIPYSYVSPENYLSTNILGTLNILNAAKNLNFQKIILTSTSEVYGSAQFVPITEKHPINAQSPYAATKVAADSLGMSFHKSFGMPVSILRPFNTFGPRQSARAIIPTIITQILSKKKIIKVGSLSPTRDFTYVEDTAAAFERCLKEKKSIGKIINAGSGYEISINNLIQTICNLMNYRLSIKVDKSRMRPKDSEVDRLLANSDLAKKLLKWDTKYKKQKNLNYGLKKTIDWFEINYNKYYKPDIYNI